MTDLIKDVQKLEVDSKLITLFELELDTDITTNSYAYFHEGLEEDLTTIKFRNFTADSNGKYQVQEYEAIPIAATGFEVGTGPSSRPTLTMANVLSVLSDALEGLTNEDLIGKKLIRRKTLYKYCHGQSGDQGDYTAPIEFPRETYLIDRIAQETPVAIVFELASPFDLEKITLPRRQVIGQGCPWKYQGADPSLAAGQRQGGCTWSRFSRVTDVDGNTYTNFVNKADEPVIPLSYAPTSNYTNDASITKNYIYRQQKTGLKRILPDGKIVTGKTSFDYWQATETETSPGTPSKSNPFFRRVRVFREYSTSADYHAYTNIDYNDYVSYTIGSDPDDKRTLEDHPRLFRVKNQSQRGKSPFKKTSNTETSKFPQQGNFWERADICGKSLNSCMQRYQFSNTSINSSSDKGPNVDRNEVITLKFGGFPSSRKYNR